MSTILGSPRRQDTARELGHRGKGCLAVIIAVAVLVGGGYFVFDRAAGFLSGLGSVPDYTGPGKTPVVVTIPAGASVTAIGQILVHDGVVRSTKAFDRVAANDPQATSIQAGSYSMRTQLPASTALQILLSPGRYRIRSQVTVQEGLRLSAQAAQLAKGSHIPAAQLLAVLRHPQALGLPAYAHNNPEGFLFPDSYEVTGQTTATTLLRQMVSRYNAVAAGIGLEARARALHRSPYDVVIVASIIEREVSQGGDRAKVAQVLYNRLARGMNLQLDSTVLYAVGKDAAASPTNADLASNSPYNTYKHKGLPPGPISAPGKAALEAAANPTPGSWLYFVTVNYDTGETKFATTYAGHQRNVAEWQGWCHAHPGRC